MTTTERRWFDFVRDEPVDFDGRIPLDEWVESLPDFVGVRPSMTCNGYLNLLRHMLAGGSVPYYTEPAEILRDAALAHSNEVSGLRRSLDVAEGEASRYRPTVQRLWSLVFATNKRKTMRTEDVRAALEAGRG